MQRHRSTYRHVCVYRIRYSQDIVCSYWTNEFKMFYSPDTGLDIDGAWIDMNEPSSVCALIANSFAAAHAKQYSSATTHAQTPSNKLASRICLLHGQPFHRIPTHPSSAMRPLVSVLTIATTMCRTRHMPSPTLLARARCLTKLPT